MAYTTIDRSTDNFRIKLYNGNNNAQNIAWDETDSNMQPDFLWIKSRAGATVFDHVSSNSVTGPNNYLRSNLVNGESTSSNVINTFNTNGFSVGGATYVSEGGRTYVGWGWKGSNTSASNTNGTISSTTSVNSTAGISIVSYTGNGSSGSTVGHGLGKQPKVIIVKNRDASWFWSVFHKSSYVSPADPGVLYIPSTFSRSGDTNVWGSGSVIINSSVFTIGDYEGTNQNNQNYVAYCFTDIKGFSKFSKFYSNGNDDGTFVYTGFKPSWIMMKANVNDAWSHWYMFDSKRDSTNRTDSPLYANLNTAEGYYGGSPATNYSQIDILSNGFKMRRDGNWGLGGNGREIYYMAFAEAPLVGSNDVPTTAR